MRRFAQTLAQALPALLVLALLLGTTPSWAQVTVRVGNVAGETGTTDTVPILVSDLGGEGVLSYQFTLDYDPAVISITGVDKSGTLSEDFDVVANPSTGRLQVSAAGTEALSGEGTLLVLDVSYVGSGNSGLTFTQFMFNEGVPPAAVTNGTAAVADVQVTFGGDTIRQGRTVTSPITLSGAAGEGILSYEFTLTYDDSIVDVSLDASGTLSENFDVVVNAQPGMLTVSAAGTTPIDDDGALINVVVDAEAAGDAGFAFTEFFFNEGSPSAAVAVQPVTVTANVAPVFTVGLEDTITVREDVVTTIDLDATDADGDAITYAIVAGPDFVSIDATTGVLTIDADAADAGTYTLTVSATDGALTVTDTATIVVQDAPARVQVIHSAPDPYLNPIDVYVNGTKQVDDLAYREGTGPDHIRVASAPATLSIARGNTVSADDALFTFNGVLTPGDFVAVALGTATVPETEDVALLVFEAMFDAPSDDSVYINVVHGSPDAPVVDVNVIDDTPNHAFVMKLADDLDYAETTGYMAVAPGMYNIQLTTAGGTEIETYRLNLAPFAGETITLIANGLVNPPNGFSDAYGLALFGVTGDGEPVRTRVVTDTEDEPTAQLPTEFTMQGNYPNPFNPSTAIRFDLPSTAEVTVEVVDVLGRKVLSVPSQTVTAGANRSIQIDGSSLASGTYLYRVVAKSAVDTHVAMGKMTLLK